MTDRAAYRADESAMPTETEVVVIGAGLAGMAAARVVAEAGHEVVVIEAGDDIGGRVRTDDVDGFRLDRGFQVLLTSYPELNRQVDLHALDLRRFDPGAVLLADDPDQHRFWWVGDPIRRPRTLLDTAASPVGNVSDKARILAQRFRLKRADPRSLLGGDDRSTAEALAAEGFSEAIIERFFRPLVGGIQLDPSLATSRRMFDIVLRSLIIGDAAVPARGMGMLSAQLASHLPQRSVWLNQEVVEVQPTRAKLKDGHEIAARAVVVATEGPVAARLLDLKPVGSNPTTCVWYAIDSSPLPEPFSRPLVVLDPVGPALNLVPLSTVAPAYAPANTSLLVAACPGLADAGIEGEVRAQFARRISGTFAGNLRHLRTDVIQHGQPTQRPPFNPKQKVALGDGLFVCGDHRDTASIQGALFSGRRCGEAVVASL